MSKFKLSPPYEIDNTPIYNIPDEKGVLGRANDCGSIVVNKDIRDKKLLETVISHEKVHLEQMKRGDLSYDGEYIYWKGKRYKRGVKDGSKSYPWEKEAYKKEKK
jgi:hypothetical protein